MIFCLVASTQLQAEATPEERLKTATGIERVNILNDLAFPACFRVKNKAVEYASEALTLARKLKDRQGEAKALKILGIASGVGGDNAKYIDYMQQALKIYRDLGDPKGEAAVLNNLGIVYRTISQQKALAYYQQSLRIEENLQNDDGIARTASNIGNIYTDQGDYKKAMAYLDQALQLHRRLGNLRDEGNDLSFLGTCYGKLGNFPKALELYLAAIRAHHAVGNRDGECLDLVSAGDIYMDMKKYPEAENCFGEALAIIKEVGNVSKIHVILQSLGKVHLLTQRYGKALDLYKEALLSARRMEDGGGIIACLNGIGSTKQHLNQYQDALKYHLEAIALGRSVNDKAGLADALNNAGRCCLELHDSSQAQKLLTEGLQLALSIGSKDKARDSYVILSHQAEMKGDFKNALSFYRKQVALDQEMIDQSISLKLTELQVGYQTEKKENEITLLGQEKIILKRENELQRLRMFSMLGGFAAVLAILGLLFKRYLHMLAFWRKKHRVGRYLLGDRLGSGGLGIVYQASDLTRKAGVVAIKLIREEFSQDPVLTRRLKHEAIIIDQLNHPNIVKVFERGEHDQQIYIVMELLHGRSMADVLRNDGPMDVATVIAIGLQLADALAAIHAKGIVHRDLKPENVMLTEQQGRPMIKLLDFDIAVGTNLTRLTETGRIMGTLHYIPPEQITDQLVLASGDIYSLGVLLYEALTGMKPFPGELASDIIRQILGSEPIPPRRLRPGLPPELDQLLLAMLAKDPTLRPNEGTITEQLQSARERS